MNILNYSLATDYVNAKSMWAIGMTTFPEIGNVAANMEMLAVSVPQPANDQVIVKMMASSMHVDEIYAAQGTALGRFYGPKHVSNSNPFLMGASVSGNIVALGKDVETFNIGDNVIAIPSEHMESGEWAMYRCIGEKWVMRKPAELSHVEAAAVTMAACVAWGGR